MQGLELLSWDLILALAGRYWSLQACPAVLRPTKNKIRSPRTPRDNVMPRAQHASLSERSRQRNSHLPQLGGSWGCGLSLPAAALRSGVWSQSHPTHLSPPSCRLENHLSYIKLPCSPSAGFAPQACSCTSVSKRGGLVEWRTGAADGSLPSSQSLLLPAVSSLIIFFFSPWIFHVCCSCLAGNFSCSSATCCCHRSLLTQYCSRGPKEEWPPSPYQQGNLCVEGPSWHRSEEQGNYLRLQFLQVMPGRSCISGKQEAALPE